MADTIKLKAARPRGSVLDRVMAGFLAAAVAFVALAMPGDIFSGLVSATGLPGVLPAAQPPLGGTARLLVAIVGAIGTFLIVAALLRALNKPTQRRTGKKPAEVRNEPPRLRRADAHPDAPARSPILAGRELGVPLDEMAIEERPTADLADVENVDFEAEWERPLPGFIDEDSTATVAEPAEWEPVDEMLDPSAFIGAKEPAGPEGESQPSSREADEAAAPAASDIPFWVPEGAAPAEPVWSEPEVSALDAEPEPPLAVPFRKVRTRPEPSAPLSELAERLPEERTQDTGAMLNRLEHGLDRRGTPLRAGADAELDQRLRSALGDLKKMSGRR